MIKFIDMTGKTEDEAIRRALEQLGLERDDVSVEILERAKSGFLGIGGSPATVRVSYDDGQPEPVKPEPKSAAPKAEKKPVYCAEVLQKEVRAREKQEREAKRGERRAEPKAEKAPREPAVLGEEIRDEKSEQIRTFLSGLLEHMDAKADVKVYEVEKNRYKVILEGEKLGALIEQYGGFIELSDMLLLSAIDNNLVQATKLLGSQAGRTLDTITREVLNGGTNVQYAEGQVDSRANLCGGSTTDSQNHYLTVDAVRRAVRYLKVMNAPKINGYYAGIIHPDCSYDLMSDPKWVNVKTYSDPDGIYEGEIGRIEGVRFVETSEAKVFTHAGKDYETGTTSSGTVTPKASARDVYSTLILGADAYGVTEITGGGLQHIVKQLGSAGTADPLDQRATAGWKATKVAERLVEAYMVRIETCSTFNS